MLQLSQSNLLAAAIWSQTNSSGFWQDATNWAGGRTPNLAFGGTYITNRDTKTVIIDAATPLTNLYINSLNIWAPTNSTNTLLLQDVGINNPLVVSNQTLTIANRGAISVTNSSLVVTGMFINFNVWAGNVTLDSGTIVAREEPPTPDVTVVTRIGRTNAATLTINGGEMNVSQLLLGESPGAQYGRSHGTIDLNGGRLAIAAEFSIGDGLGCTGLVRVTGGELHVANQGTNIMRIGDYGRGEMTVTNATAVIGNVSIARHDAAVGVLTLQDNSLMQGSDDLSIGRFSGSTGLMHLAGGTFTLTNHPVWVGREGVGQLVVSNGLLQTEGLRVAFVTTNTARGTVTLAGGTTLLSSNLLLGDGVFTNGSVTMTGGELNITNEFRTAQLAILSGAMTLNGGICTVDELVSTNAIGTFAFEVGTLHSKGTVVSNGAPFVVGNGTSPATFVLDGGTHVFADGLVISPNATLTGCGTIIGTVNNNGGTMSTTNCGSGGLPPVITQQPVSLTVTQEATATFTVVADASPAPIYQWRFAPPGGDEIELAGATATSLTISNAQPTNAGNYRVVVSNLSGSVTSEVASLTVLVPPTITAPPQSLTVVAGSNAVFTVTATGSAPLSYQWRFNGANLAGATLASYTVTGAQPTNAGGYTVVVTNVVGSVTSNPAFLVVTPAAVAPSITAQPASQTVPAGSNVTFSVSASGTDPLSYQWWHDQTPLTNTGASMLVLNNVQLSGAGGYWVVVTNVAGSVTSVVATLRVLVPTSFTRTELTGDVAAFTFPSLAGLNYVVEFKDRVDGPGWATLDTLAGTGGLLTVTNSVTNAPTRFFRLRVE